MPDYNFLMDSRLRPGQLRVINQLGRLAASQGLNLYLGGGAVRDLTTGLETPRDLNFMVEGNIQKILRPLESAAKRHGSSRPIPKPAGVNGFDLQVESIRFNPKLNVADVVFEGGIKGEIASSRVETYNSPGKPPQLSPGTVFDDLRQRDFSVNAMAISLHPNSRGLLLDPTNGAADIERKELRALHSRSFFDDPSRIYRLFRLSQRLDYRPDERTARWLDLALENRAWAAMREEQQSRELRALLAEESSGRILKALRERGVLGGLDAKFASDRIDFDRFERVHSAIRTAAAHDDALLLNFLALVAKLSSGEQNRLAKKVFEDAKTVKSVLNHNREAAKLAKAVASPKVAKLSQVYTLLHGVPNALAASLLIDATNATVQNRVKAFFTKVPPLRAQLPRAELEAIGLPPGPKFEQILERVLLHQLDGKLKTPNQLTQALRGLSGIKAPPPPPPVPPKPPVKGKAAKTAAKPQPTAESKELPPSAPAAGAVSTAAMAAPKSTKHAAAQPPELTKKGQAAPTPRPAPPPVPPRKLETKAANKVAKTPAKSARKVAATAPRPKTAKAAKLTAASAGPKRNVAKPNAVVKSKGPAHKKAGSARRKR
jgi:tRNA nucleotidyltransferase (CCA-adding enzyme)